MPRIWNSSSSRVDLTVLWGFNPALGWCLHPVRVVHISPLLRSPISRHCTENWWCHRVNNCRVCALSVPSLSKKLLFSNSALKYHDVFGSRIILPLWIYYVCVHCDELSWTCIHHPDHDLLKEITSSWNRYKEELLKWLENNRVCNFFLRNFLAHTRKVSSVLKSVFFLTCRWNYRNRFAFFSPTMPFIPVLSCLTEALVNNRAVWDRCGIFYNNCTPTQVILGCAKLVPLITPSKSILWSVLCETRKA